MSDDNQLFYLALIPLDWNANWKNFSGDPNWADDTKTCKMTSSSLDKYVKNVQNSLKLW